MRTHMMRMTLKRVIDGLDPHRSPTRRPRPRGDHQVHREVALAAVVRRHQHHLHPDAHAPIHIHRHDRRMILRRRRRRPADVPIVPIVPVVPVVPVAVPLPQHPRTPLDVLHDRRMLERLPTNHHRITLPSRPRSRSRSRPLPRHPPHARLGILPRRRQAR